MNIIDGLQKKTIKRLERLITSIGWLIMMLYIVQTMLSIVLWLFNLSNFYNKLFIFANIYVTIGMLITTVAIAVFILLLLYTWGTYNYKKYANLNRRKFPKDVTSEELEVYFGLSSSSVEKMQNEKAIVLEKTII